MFQFNSELYELTQKYQALTKQKNAHNWELLKQDILILLIGIAIIIALNLIVMRVHETIVDKKLKKLKNDQYYVEDLYKDDVNYYEYQKKKKRPQIYLNLLILNIHIGLFPSFHGPQVTK